MELGITAIILVIAFFRLCYIEYTRETEVVKEVVEEGDDKKEKEKKADWCYKAYKHKSE